MYKFFLEKKDFTIKYSSKIRNLLRLNDGMEINKKNWNGFRRSLSNTIIKQNTFAEIRNIKVPIEIIYGVLDNLVVKKSVNQLSELKNVSIKKLQAAYHLVDKRFSRFVADCIYSKIN